LPYQKRESLRASIRHRQEGNSRRLPVTRWERNTRSVDAPTRGGMGYTGGVKREREEDEDGSAMAAAAQRRGVPP
jgi:hypothetical protein